MAKEKCNMVTGMVGTLTVFTFIVATVSLYLSITVFIQTSSTEKSTFGIETRPPFVPGTNSTVNLTGTALAEYQMESLEQQVLNQSGIIRQLMLTQEELSVEISELQSQVDLLENQKTKSGADAVTPLNCVIVILVLILSHYW